MASIFRRLRAALSRRRGFSGRLPDKVDHEQLVAQAADFFALTPDAARRGFSDYRRLHERHSYAAALGERKTLSFEEAYLLYLAALHVRPAQVVEIGTQYGKSTRRILDLFSYLQMPVEVTCFDIADELRFVRRDEVQLDIQDITGQAREIVFEGMAPGLTYLDARPYALLKDVIGEFLAWSPGRPVLLAIHDCTPHLYNPKMTVARDDAEVGSHTGVWERHVLGELFATPNERLEDVRTPAHRLRIFGTPHGLALIAPLDGAGRPVGVARDTA